MVSSASAVPLLSMGSNANYQFNASIQSSQSCSASFPPSAQINYAQLACGPYRPMTLVEIVDNGTCTQAQSGFSCFYNSPYYYPTYLSLGTTVMWFNRGSLLHTATSVTETGSFPQSINLSTRVESPGTATSVILSIAHRMLAYLGSSGYYGYGYGYSPVLSQLLSDQKEVYTLWWVNGPLANGQPVEILTGYSSVSGSEMVNLGPGNNRNAWIVDSEISQSLSTVTPPIGGAGGSTDSHFKLNLRFDYDHASDLLLRSNAVVSVQSTQIQSYNPGDFLSGPSGYFPVSDPVTVTHHMDASIPVALQLKSTNLDLSKRTPAGSIGNGQTSTGGTGASCATSSLHPAI